MDRCYLQMRYYCVKQILFAFLSCFLDPNKKFLMWRQFAYVTDFLSWKVILGTWAPGDKGKRNYEELKTEKSELGKVQMIRNLSAKGLKVLLGKKV